MAGVLAEDPTIQWVEITTTEGEYPVTLYLQKRFWGNGVEQKFFSVKAVDDDDDVAAMMLLLSGEVDGIANPP